MVKGIIIKAISGFYYVETGNAIIECKERGHLKNDREEPLVGDSVEITIQEGSSSGVLEKILPRKNCLSRPPVANVDKLFIVSSYTTPAPDTLVIDRLIAIAEDKDIEPVIVFNKCDMGDFGTLERIYLNSGFHVYVVSAETKNGLDKLYSEFSGCLSVLTGNTGVGKSSLLNALFGELNLKTGEISKKLGRGRHTTRHSELFRVAGGYIADTPGFSSVDLVSSDFFYKDNLQFAFREFEKYRGGCRFSSCTHRNEPGCAVKEAVESGGIDASRYNSYLALYDELSSVKEWKIKQK